MSKQKLLCQKAWLKALGNPNGLQLFFKSASGMYEARKHLYEAVRDAKAMPMESPELARAAEAIQIVLLKAQNGLWMRHRATNDATLGLEAALGETIEEQEDPAAAESLRRILAGSGKAAVDSEALLTELEHKPNPFFDRTKE